MKKIKIGLSVLIGLIIFIASVEPAGAVFVSENNKDFLTEPAGKYAMFPKYNLSLESVDSFVQDEIIVKFKKDEKSFRVIKVPKGAVEEKITQYLKRADVKYAEPNYIVHIEAVPDDPGFSGLWGLNNTGQTGGTADADIDALEAWEAQTGSQEVLIAVIDTGVDYSHEDLEDNMWANDAELNGEAGVDDDNNGFIDDVKGWDFYNNNNNPFDDNGHGTHCAGTIGAVGNNGIGVVGVNWNVKLLPIKFLNSSGSGSISDAVEAVNYATLMGVDVMSNSWGGRGSSQALEDAISAANEAGILFIAAAGNANNNNDITPFYPASHDVPNVVAVAATDDDDQKASFSNYGAQSVDVGAPGVNIYSTVPTGSCSLCDPSGYKSIGGTSMAAPHVAGVAGLIKAQFPELTSDGIKLRLLAGVDIIPSLSEITVGGGRINAFNCLEEDDISPTAINNITASSSTIDSVTLEWTATGDDGSVGTASIYDIRYSISEITDGTWDMALKVVGEPKPQPSGSAEIFTVTELEGNALYYFAMKVFDNVGNSTGLSNVVSQTTKTKVVIFGDNMESGENGWTHSGAGDNWELGIPTSGPRSAHSPFNVWATNLDGDYNTAYMNAQLVSPSFNLSKLISSKLTFYHYYETERRDDGGIVEISTDGGNIWMQITPVYGYPQDDLDRRNPLGRIPSYSGYSGDGWHLATFDISDYDGSNNVNIRFRFGTDRSINRYYGWYIDDVVISGGLTGPNQAPIADAGGPYADDEGSEIVFNGSGSNDADGDTLSYSWDFGDGSTGTGVNPTHIYSAGGVYTITLIVNDGLVDSEPAITTADIQEMNNFPIAIAGTDKSAFIGETISFDGSGSYDSDGFIVSYAWDFGDGATASGEGVSHSYDSSGDYTVILTVTDDEGLINQDSALVIISEEIVGPTAVINIDISKRVRSSYWRATASVSLVDINGNPIKRAKIEGTWTGVYSKNVSDSTSSRGEEDFRTRYIRETGVVTFTINKVVGRDGQEYVLTGETSDSISNTMSK